MSDPIPTPEEDQPVSKAAARAARAEETRAMKAKFTKAPQPELPLAERREKAGLNRNRIGIWIVVSGFALYLIITGVIGILTKAR